MAGHAMLSAAHLGPVDADEDPADHLRSKWLVQDNQIFVNWYGTYFLLLYVPCCVIVLLSYLIIVHTCIFDVLFHYYFSWGLTWSLGSKSLLENGLVE